MFVEGSPRCETNLFHLRDTNGDDAPLCEVLCKTVTPPRSSQSPQTKQTKCQEKNLLLSQTQAAVVFPEMGEQSLEGRQKMLLEHKFCPPPDWVTAWS